jgi:alpha,alpha-trehalase
MYIHELGQLFEAVQMNTIYEDGKTFPDCFPKHDLSEILEAFSVEKDSKNFDLKAFVHEHFEEPNADFADFKSDPNKSISEHVESLWNVLTREPDMDGSSLIPLPNAYIVPGGRFREIYYWDSYFTLLGLQVSKRVDMIENMVNNFAFLLNKVGHIPNGNRAYYVGRSQPPFFSLMVKVLSEERGKNVLLKYLPELEKEYQFWMKGGEILNDNEIPTQSGLRGGEMSTHSELKSSDAADRVVRLEDGTFMNRYWDENDTPRPESYKEDVEIAHASKRNPAEMYRHLRAAAESGWDFSSRWFKSTDSFASIRTTELIPVDLNCLMLHLEQTLAEAYQLANDAEKALFYQNSSKKRQKAIEKYCWHDEKGFYFDYDFVTNQQTEHYTLAAVFPLFFKIATQNQAAKVAEILASQFLKTGGLTTTLAFTGQQWDAPNGWAPLQWMAFKGLQNYGFSDLANQVKTHWLNANMKIYEKTGKMTEKYNVFNQDLEAGGGEYPLQDGFGWTNGVFLALKKVMSYEL